LEILGKYNLHIEVDILNIDEAHYLRNEKSNFVKNIPRLVSKHFHSASATMIGDEIDKLLNFLKFDKNNDLEDFKTKNIFYLQKIITKKYIVKEVIIKIKNDFSNERKTEVTNFNAKYDLKNQIKTDKKKLSNTYLNPNFLLQYNEIILCPIIPVNSSEDEFKEIINNFYKPQYLNNRLKLLKDFINYFLIIKKESVLIFSHSNKFIYFFKYFLNLNFPDILNESNVFYIDSKTSSQNKTKIISQFENKEKEILLTSYVICGKHNLII
jgi:hypothetical protein